MISIDSLLSTRQGGDYQRESFDSFLKKVSFSYKIPSIHIAGTNGKGSTANYIANIYRKCGLKVGLYTSPALVEVNETITINGEEISDDEITRRVNENKKLFEKFELSSFEILTYIAFTYFQDQGCDIAVIECGMGGEIDATNIFTPILSIITSISLEHTSFLGRSISEIALMKAGIIKDEIPVLTRGDLADDAINVISNVAKEKRCPLITTSLPGGVMYDNGYSFNYSTYLNLKIPSHAEYSVDDAIFALEAVAILNEQFPVSEEQIKAGLLATKMPARMDIVSEKPFVIIDGAHNPEAMQKLAKSLQNPVKNRAIHTIFACFRDKNLNSLLAIIGEVSEDVTLTTFDHPRARTFEDYFLYADEHVFEEDCVKAIKDAMAKYPDDVILITGSLAFAGYIRNLFEIGVFKGE